MGIDEHDHEGRVITLELDSFFLITVYTPNSQDGLRRLEYRMKWEDDFRAYLKKLEEKKPVIVCGDLNVAHREIDLKNRKPIARMPDLRMKNVLSLLRCSIRDLRILSVISTRSKREFIHGGPIVSKRERRMPVGVLIIFSLLLL